MTTVIRLIALPFTCAALLFGLVAIGLVAAADLMEGRRK
jgi:hypothetical protein